MEDLDNQAFVAKGGSLVLTERMGCMAREVLMVLLGLGAGQETWDSMAPQDPLALMVISAMMQPTAHAQIGIELSLPNHLQHPIHPHNPLNPLQTPTVPQVGIE